MILCEGVAAMCVLIALENSQERDAFIVQSQFVGGEIGQYRMNKQARLLCHPSITKSSGRPLHFTTLRFFCAYKREFHCVS